MMIMEYENGKIESMSSNISPVWFASKLKKNGGIKTCYDVIFPDFVIDNFEELKGVLKKYEIKEDSSK